MKKLLLVLVAITGIHSLVSSQQTFTITSSGFQFVPATTTITAGDTVLFNQSSSHPIREVSQATWNANGSTSNGGFDNVMPGTKIKFNTPGTYYFVCTVHFGSGMKGQIVVNPASSVEEESANVSIKAYPSPVVSNLNLSLELNKSEELSVEIYNLIGEQVYFKSATNYASGLNTLQIDFSDLANGAYFIKVIGKDDQYSIKIMK